MLYELLQSLIANCQHQSLTVIMSKISLEITKRSRSDFQTSLHRFLGVKGKLVQGIPNQLTHKVLGQMRRDIS